MSAVEELFRLLHELEARINHLENSPNRAFILIEYETLHNFHLFNLCFKQFWDEFDRNSASQLLQFQKIVKMHSELCNNYVELFREQLDYLENVIDFDNECIENLPPIVFSEENSTDVIGYYKELLKDYKDEKGKPQYDIILDCETHTEIINEKTIPIDFYMFSNEKLNDAHYKGLLGMYLCLDAIFSLMCVVCSYPDELLSGYKPNKEDIIRALENELRQHAKDIGVKVERDLKKIAQELKPSRNKSLTPDIWGKVMEEEDELYELAISGHLGEYKAKHFYHIDEDQRKQWSDNYPLLQKIKTACIDEEFFDIRLSIDTHNLLSSLNADNLDLFYNLVLRRNIIQREMFPEKLNVKYVEWLNTSDEHHPENGGDIGLEIPLPDRLATEQAIKYWEQLKHHNFVNSHYMLLENTTRQQAAYIAELFAEKLKIKNKWKTFEDFWLINNLAQEKNKRIELGKLPSRSDEIDEIFKD